ncbi:uncharacterized protein LOC112458394 isoform X1 [Temnothorax curvispinosus]|uniref:Uncharacterized protein LOC112458394 isoform X1 n=1 Tax=Temnothorax curvispinosus TaxID=300111 RepID=A0A6J1QAC1_9HYME|nr:uncharacterized protein LOC112458394 isoform X1 [Temnothorax curvispinosus]XP_024877772.1 uncharacterized protein LOC112458394 isoform X1 [Temnothorax curvispinosus]
MAMASSSKTAVDEAPQENCIWIELKLLQSIVVQSRLGQTVLRLMDNFLWVVEKCAEWSLPRQEVRGDENRKDSGKPELVRPLPWLLFLPSLVLLRVIRATLNIGGYILGYPEITPSGMVKFVQICRRYLNKGMNKGTKERYETKDKRSSINEAKKALIKSIRLTLSSLSCLDASKPSLSPPPTKIHVSSVLDPDPVTALEEKSVTESTESTAKLKDSSSESEKEEKKETLNEKIDRLALENSEDDEDFDPVKCGFSSDTSSDENSDDGNVSPTEVHAVQEDAKKFLKTNIERFLNAEQTSAPAPQEETVELDCEKRSSAKESRDKVEERLVISQGIDTIDSPECYTPDRSSQEGDPTFYSPISSDSDAPKESSVAEQCTTRKSLKTNEFINGEARFISASTISESKSPGETNNGAVMQKRSTNVSKCHKGKRTSHGNRKKK